MSHSAENKIPNVSDLVQKMNYDAKMSGNDTEWFTTSVYNKIMGKILDKKIKEKGLLR